MPKVEFKISLGSRDAQALGLDFTKCKAGSTLDLPEATVEAVRKACGKCSVSEVDKKSGPSDADLEALTAPEATTKKK